MKKLIIGIDVDSTILDTVFQQWGWIEYLNGLSYHYISPASFKEMNEIDYYLGNYYPDLTEQEVMSFWNGDIYDHLKPYEKAVEVINKWAKQGHTLCFISICKKGHFGSKVDFIKRNFDIPKEQFAFMATKQKGLVNVDLMIDDRVAYLNYFSHRPEVAKILIDTPFTQEVDEADVKIDLKTKDWYEIEKFVEEFAE